MIDTISGKIYSCFDCELSAFSAIAKWPEISNAAFNFQFKYWNLQTGKVFLEACA